MAYVICEPCVDVKDTACVDVCPVDCIHTVDGDKQLYINPVECIDCGACEPACPVTAIFVLDEVPDQWQSYVELNAKFFETFVKPTATGEAGEEGAGEAKSKKDELGIEEFVQLPQTPTSSLRPLLRPLVMISQPILGAFSAKFKAELEEMAGSPKIFSAAISTGINCLINLTLYPLLLFLMAVEWAGVDLFAGKGNAFIFFGVVLAIGEGVFRFKDDLVTTSSDEKSRYGAAFYGWIPGVLASLVLPSLQSILTTKPRDPRSTLPGAVLTGDDDPIYSEDTRERYRRYGMANTVQELADRYVIRVEFPRWVPNSEYKKEYNLPDRMPDYTYDANLDGKMLVITARLEDLRFTPVLGRTSSFPNGFMNTFYIDGQPENFKATHRDKVLEIIVPKSGKVEDLVIEHKVHYAKLKG